MSKSGDNGVGSSIANTPVSPVEMESLLDEKCKDLDLLFLSCKLSELSIEVVGRCLGLQKSQEEDALKRVTEHHQDHNKIHLLLMKWREVNGDRATWGALIQQSQSDPEIARIINDGLQETLLSKLFMNVLMIPKHYARRITAVLLLGGPLCMKNSSRTPGRGPIMHVE